MVAIGRALMARPKLLLLDEPSLGIAPQIIRLIARSLVEINQRDGITIVLVTHEADIAAHAKRQVRFHDGCLVSASLLQTGSS